MNSTVYEEALERILSGNPKRVPAGTKISFDSVSLEAGRGRGSLKPSRLGNASIRKKILEAKKALDGPINHDVKRLKSQVQKTKTYRELYESSLNRELMLMQKLFDLENKE